MPNPGFGPSQEEEEGQKATQSAGDVDLTRRRRTTIRSQITSTIRQIRANIDQSGSRGGIAGLVKHLQDLATRSTLLHTDLLTVEDASENDRQEEKHLMYVQQIGEAIAEADEHLRSRASEAPSEVTGGINQDSRRAARASEEEIRAAKQLIEQTRTQAEQARRRAEELNVQQQQAEEALQNLQPADPDPDNFSSVSNRGEPFSKLAADWKWKQSQQNAAPDDWIDGYADTPRRYELIFLTSLVSERQLLQDIRFVSVLSGSPAVNPAALCSITRYYTTSTEPILTLPPWYIKLRYSVTGE
ncbi:hypothetical protein GHT06_007571 [Daphnia sinensis]|uniref:Uncharacterized protein n=1 Tax=Daphnia sinensis TaxID=1820382 RepID=A0AAD5KT90_9CRUS|nr:hypothetical protein GHT06_007571 [Daphnia sinensis]